MRRPKTSWLLTIALGSGCGGVLTGTDPGPPLAQLHGTVGQATPTPPKSPYAEFLWAMPVFFPGDSSPTQLDLGIVSGHSLVPIQSEFPASFDLNIYSPPPSAMLSGLEGVTNSSGEPSFLFSIATVLVFDDVKGNGNFDLVDAHGQPTSWYGDGDTFSPDLLRGWMRQGAVMYVAQLSNPSDPALASFFANPGALRLGFQAVSLCRVSGTEADTRLQVSAVDAPISLQLVEPTTTPLPESQPLWAPEPSALPDCVP
jgi:hypothetical protein